MKTTPLSSILNKLGPVRKQGKEYIGRCPAHADKTPSLSVSTGDDGRVLLHCHAGCATDSILGKIGLEAKDLFADNGHKQTEPPATYDYTDATGKLLYQVCRKVGKHFSQRRPDGSGGWVYNLNGVQRVPYRLPSAIEAIRDSKTVYVVEGEKDADRLAALGLAATTNSGGAGKWLDSLSAHLKGAKAVILPDNDQPGRDHAKAVAASLKGTASSVKIVELPGLEEKGDVSDWLSAGNGKTDLIELLKDAVPRDPQAEPEAPPIGTLLSEVTPETVDWLWEGYVPRGKIIVIDGDPGLGKSTACLDIAARVSTGATMPDGTGGGESSGVVVLSAEDGLADTIRPRLDAAGADCSKIVALTAVKDETGEDRPPVIPDDLDIISQAIERVNARLLIIDPLMAFLSGNIQSNRDQDVRRALHRVANLAEATGVAVLVVRHLNKGGGGNATYRGGGSIGIIGAARAGFLIGPNPDDENRRVMAPIKSNLCKAPSSLAFHLEDCGGVARVVWDGASNHTANALLSAAIDQEEGDALREAKDVLRDILSQGPVEVSEATKKAKAAGVSDRTLRRARESLGVRGRKDGAFNGPWFWELEAAEVGQPPTILGQDGQDGRDLRERQEALGQDGEGAADVGQWPSNKELGQDGGADEDLTGFAEVEI